MASVVLVTGASTGIGDLTAREPALADHLVHASMRDVEGRNAGRAGELVEFGRSEGVDLRVVELDVQSQESADAAMAVILGDAGRLDSVVHNAGHLYVGYVEAFTAEDVHRLFDVNAVGIQRVNRAVLPHMRERGPGTLLYVGSTTSVVVPPFMGPYVASKSGPFTRGTEYFPHAGHAADAERDRAHVAPDPLVARTEEATSALFPPGVDAHPGAVAEEITRVLGLPAGTRPFRTVVDFSDAGVDEVNEVLRRTREKFVTRLGFGELLHVKTARG